MENALLHFKAMDAEQLGGTNGGGFAYDLGRVLRFLGLSGGTVIGTANAIADWMIADAINQAANS
jgi:hypothetical protein